MNFLHPLTHYDSVRKAYARLAMLEQYDLVEEEEDKYNRNIDMVLQSAVHPTVLPKHSYVKELSVPGLISVVDNKELKNVIIVFHSTHDFYDVKETKDTNHIRDVIYTLTEDVKYMQKLGNYNKRNKKSGIVTSNDKKRKTIIKKWDTHIEAVQNVFEYYDSYIERLNEQDGRLHDDEQEQHRMYYTYVGYSTGALALYYSILRSHDVAKRTTAAYMFNITSGPALMLRFSRKLHPKVQSRMYMIRSTIDPLSKDISRLYGTKHIQKEIYTQRMSRVPSIKYSQPLPRLALYFRGIRLQNIAELRERHALKRFM